MKSTPRPTLHQTIASSGKFQLELQNRFDALETTIDVNVEDTFHNVVKTMRDVGKKLCVKQCTGTKSKLSDETLDLMRERRENKQGFTLPEKQAVNKRIRKLVRHDLRRFNTNHIMEAIDQNRGSKLHSSLVEAT